ncbi:patatin-like phospholipase family protein [Paucibacter sp. TC2R-5]|uniref:patatin-like phospholipase family protein n=1 Tax=Paucibacter sp. TC2R-5 TaxID=2893555 RepID=UPI0021E50543|nr:patatin-like phospholipase family protein [Paucibacter sp. TC2R-5]MCV2360062.1 patatin-like phospholipase family protein [Paucibacter sp. TC2R-5]
MSSSTALRRSLRHSLQISLLGLLVLLSACGSLPRNPVPPRLSTAAAVPGMPDIRARAGLPSAAMEADLAASFKMESPNDFPASADGSVRYAHLALSGGGANGAFGAGFINGWTSSGTRPVFKIVTGVSTGALMAPFAFLGPAYDPALREFYTTTSSRDIFKLGSLLRQLLSGEALASTEPLAAIIERNVDAKFLGQIALAHGQGRRLYIGTADLDARAFVIWNMGLIASSGRPEALELFRKVMLASASIPVAFPPVYFKVEVQDESSGEGRAEPRSYDEMHVDGGVGSRVFVNGGVFRSAIIQERGGLGAGHEDFYVIHNGQLLPVPDPVARSMSAIAIRVLDATGRVAVLGDLFRIYGHAQQFGAGFRWVTIPNDVSMTSAETFDPVQMNMLYQFGYHMAQSREPWATAPPGRQGDPAASD